MHIRFLSILLFMATVSIGTVNAQTVVCDGLICGGTGVVNCDGTRDYVYRVTIGDSPTALDSVFIGTHESDLSTFTNICMPTGWICEIVDASMDDFNAPTMHGWTSPGTNDACPYVILFRNETGVSLSLTPTDFGFDHEGWPHDVEWKVSNNPAVMTNWTEAVGHGFGPVHGPGCDTSCVGGRVEMDTCLAGIRDNFNTSDGDEQSSPSPELLVEMENIAGGANPYFDSDSSNLCFGHTFEQCWESGCCITAGQLCFFVTPITGGSENDNIILREDEGNTIWFMRLKYLRAYYTGNPEDTTWEVGDTIEICLDLANLPLVYNAGTDSYFPTNVLGMLEDNDLDVLIQDDTKIDYLEIQVSMCCDTCNATGDVDGDGMPLAMNDYLILVQFLDNAGSIPGPIYEADLNGDCFIDQADVDMFDCYFANGMSCFPVYPVPTCCNPNTVRGACCRFDTCDIRTEYNCARLGGFYVGDGTLCDPNPCCDTICEGYPIITDTILAGDYTMNAPPTPSSPGPELQIVMEGCHYGGKPWFNLPLNQQCFGHTFKNCWDTTCCIIGARLCFEVSATGVEPNTDVLAIMEDGVIVWHVEMNDLIYWHTAGYDDQWDPYNSINNCFNFKNMPDVGNGPDNIISTLYDGDLDFFVQDDTRVDFLMLILELCCDSGVCCLPDGSCIQTYGATECEVDWNGYYQGPGIPCSPDFCKTTISGTKYFDGNKNGVRDGGEGGLSNWDIYADNGWMSFYTITDANGEYTLSNIPVGPITITEYIPPLWLQTFPAPAMHSYFMTPGEVLVGIDFGNWTCDTTGQECCSLVSNGLLGWWPLDESGPPVARDIAGGRDGRHLGDPEEVTGKVGGAYRSDWVNYGIVRVADDPFVDINTGDFTIDAWIYPESLPAKCETMTNRCQKRVIVDNHRTMNGAGITFFLWNSDVGTAHLGFQMKTWESGEVNFITTDDPVQLNQWQHVAVTVAREPGNPIEGKFYYNGIQHPETFSPVTGTIYTTAPEVSAAMDIGHGTPMSNSSCALTNQYFSGRLDEVEIFDNALEASEIWRIYESGKCQDYCHLPRNLMVCRDQNEVTATLTICNESTYPVTYDWNSYGFSCPPYTFLDGVTFNPPSGSIIVDAASCEDVAVTISAPPTFDPGEVACYEMVITNTFTDEIFGCEGSLVKSSKMCPRIDTLSHPSPNIFLYAGAYVEVDFEVENLSDSSEILDYEIWAVPACGCGTGDSLVSLDGQTPGASIAGSIDVPLEGIATVSVNVELVEFRPYCFTDIVLKGDWNGTDSITNGPSIAIHPLPFPDCNVNGILDSIDIDAGTSLDTNSNVVPDECEFYDSDDSCVECADVNNDEQVNVGDAVFLISYIFKGGPPPDPVCIGDANGDGNTNVGDAVYLISYVFKGGPPPVETCCP